MFFYLKFDENKPITSKNLTVISKYSGLNYNTLVSYLRDKNFHLTQTFIIARVTDNLKNKAMIRKGVNFGK
jgi:hypothetical protein